MTVEVTWHEHVLVLSIARPERRNAVDHATLVALASGLEDALAGAARAVVLTGQGGSFCAGADLAGVEDEGFSHALSAVLHGLTTARAVTIAAVDGPALGAGMQLALACDVRVASSRSRFGIPAARLGLAVDGWTVRRAAALLGGATARAMLLAAETIDTERAYGIGFVQRMGDLDTALGWADEIAALAPLTIDAHKTAFERLAWQPPDDPEVASTFAAAWASADAREGRTAFLEKRAPRFRGR